MLAFFGIAFSNSEVQVRKHLCHGRTAGNFRAPGRIRTCDTGFRRAVLYPLSYEGENIY